MINKKSTNKYFTLNKQVSCCVLRIRRRRVSADKKNYWLIAKRLFFCAAYDRERKQEKKKRWYRIYG